MMLIKIDIDIIPGKILAFGDFRNFCVLCDRGLDGVDPKIEQDGISWSMMTGFLSYPLSLFCT